jgi:type III restriction enzyme
MKLHFDSKQEFQSDAVKAVTDIFEGVPLNNSDFQFSLSRPGSLLSEYGIGNKPGFSDIVEISDNIRKIQKRNGIKILSKDEITANG